MQSSWRARPHRTPAPRANILAAYRQTDLSNQEFARRHGIAATTLYRWLQRSPVVDKGGDAALIELPNVLGHPPPVPSYRVRFANGVSEEIASGFQPDEVRVLAQVIRGL